jgi:hypothetical protein
MTLQHRLDDQGHPIWVDRAELICPECRQTAHVEILRMPEPHSWYRRYGEACCKRCRVWFDFTTTNEQTRS